VLPWSVSNEKEVSAMSTVQQALAMLAIAAASVVAVAVPQAGPSAQQTKPEEKKAG
jgi:photosystem II stability/assembly factor-like uncharacterized protein